MPIGLLAAIALGLATLGYVIAPIVRQRGPRWRATARRAGAASGALDDEIEASVRAFRRAMKGGFRCQRCGPRPEIDAVYCSSCGRPIDVQRVE